MLFCVLCIVGAHVQPCRVGEVDREIDVGYSSISPMPDNPEDVFAVLGKQRDSRRKGRKTDASLYIYRDHYAAP
jgi:hypothetical protein